jgi:hypothetical protein
VEDSVRDLTTLIRDTKPFASDVIEKLPPRGDSYVSWTHYAQRLLFTHHGYSWRPTAIVEGGEGWAVMGELTLGDEIYGAVGEDKTPTAAESNAFKRACAKAGIGLHLYDHYWLYRELEKQGEP